LNSVRRVMTQKTDKYRLPVFIAVLICLGITCNASAESQIHHGSGEEALIISNIDIEIAGMQDDMAKWADIAHDLILLRPGELISQQQLILIKDKLLSSGFFKAIDLKTDIQDGNTVDILFRLAPFPLIKDIQIQGSFPVFEREVLNAMTLYTGKPFDETVLPEQEGAVRNLLENSGFIEPRVKIYSEKTDSSHVILHVDIEKELFYYIQKIDFIGNNSFSSARLKIRTNTWLPSLLPRFMSRLNKKKLDEDVKNLTEFYRSKDFPDASVTPEIEKNTETGLVIIHFLIDEGKRYDITFHGNEEFWDLTLLKDLEPLQKGNRRNIGLRKSIRNIKDRYLNAGYEECTVKQESASEDSPDQNVHPVRLVIIEGTRSLVKRLSLEGNHNIPEEDIRDQILTRPPELFFDGAFNDQTLENDIRAIKALYSKHGYRDVVIDKKIEWQLDLKNNVKLADITLPIQEGEKTTISFIRFEGMHALTEEEALKAISSEPGGPFQEYTLSNDTNQLAAAISEKGYPHVVVTKKAEIRPDAKIAEVIYSVVEGPFVAMGNIHTVGNFRTENNIIEEEMELEKDMPFSMVNMLESQRNIKNINAFETARTSPIGLKEKKDKVHLMVRVEEKKPYSLEAGFGYDTARHLYGNIRLGDQNLFGLNKNAWIDLEVSEIGYRGETGILEPRFLGTRILSSLTVFGEKQEKFNQNFGTENQGAILSFSRKLPHNFIAGLAFSLERKEQYLRDEQPMLEEEREEYDPRSILVTTPSIAYDTVDSFFRPKYGIYSSIKMDISNGLENSLDNFIKYRYEIKLYHTFFKRLTIACRGKAGHIIPAGSESNIPDDQLFYLGGLTDVRGYNENLLRFDEEHKAVGGRTLFTGTIEARFDVGFNIEIASFLDTGSIRNAPSNEGNDDFRSSVGVGLRYLFPYLPVGLQYAHKLGRIKTPEDPGRFYVTIGYIF
jgi:outer membrane protein insertion porin family